MRVALALLLLLAAPAAASAAAQDSTPRQMLEEMGFAPSEREVRRAVERAREHPLGSARNPVRVSGPGGEHAYIARLRCADGAAPRVGQRSSAGVGAFGTIVDVYPLDCGNAAPGQASLVMDMYHDDHDETQPPPGFTIEPR